MRWWLLMHRSLRNWDKEVYGEPIKTCEGAGLWYYRGGINMVMMNAEEQEHDE